MSKKWIPRVGDKVRLSAYGYNEGLIRSAEDAECARLTVVDWTMIDDPDHPEACVIEVAGSLNRYMLHNQMFEPIE